MHTKKAFLTTLQKPFLTEGSKVFAHGPKVTKIFFNEKQFCLICFYVHVESNYEKPCRNFF